MSDAKRKPQQERSRRTLEALVRATAAVLDRHGLEGTTVPLIAAEAGVSAGSVYRRFEDKDDLFRATFLNIVMGSVMSNEKHLRPELFWGMKMEATVRTLMAAIVKQFRTHPGLLTALERFLEADTDAAFKRKMAKLIATNYERIFEVLLLHCKEMKRKDAARAVRFAVLSAVTVIETRTLNNDLIWRTVLPLGDAELLDEVVGMVMGYLRTA